MVVIQIYGRFDKKEIKSATAIIIFIGYLIRSFLHKPKNSNAVIKNSQKLNLKKSHFGKTIFKKFSIFATMLNIAKAYMVDAAFKRQQNVFARLHYSQQCKPANCCFGHLLNFTKNVRLKFQKIRIHLWPLRCSMI